MEKPDLQRVIASIDATLEVFARYQGRLRASELRLQNMLSALRLQLLEEVACAGRGRGDKA